MLSPYHGKIFYFCTFACIGRVLQKHFADKATGLLVVPKWPIEILLPLLIDTLISESFHHSFQHQSIETPEEHEGDSPTMAETRANGMYGIRKDMQTKNYQTMWQTFSRTLDQKVRRNSIHHIIVDDLFIFDSLFNPFTLA